MQYDEILALVREVAKAGLSSFEYTEGNIHISMSCPQDKHQETLVSANTSAEAPAPDVFPEKEKEEQKGNLVKSPLVGTFYMAPSEDAKPFVKVGDRVKKGQTLGIVEAMKLMNEIESEYEGVVREILVDNEDAVEYGQSLFRIEE